MRAALAIAPGLLLALVAQVVAATFAGGGHGWITPFFCSPLLFVVYPIALARRFDTESRSRRADAVLLVLALVADLVLISSTRAEFAYFEAALATGALPFMLAWMLLWLGWQLQTLATLVQRRRRQE